MSVKIIIGYLRLLNRVLQQEHIDLSKVVAPELWQAFHACLENPDEHDFDVERYALLLQYYVLLFYFSLYLLFCSTNIRHL